MAGSDGYQAYLWPPKLEKRAPAAQQNLMRKDSCELERKFRDDKNVREHMTKTRKTFETTRKDSLNCHGLVSSMPAGNFRLRGELVW